MKQDDVLLGEGIVLVVKKLSRRLSEKGILMPSLHAITLDPLQGKFILSLFLLSTVYYVNRHFSLLSDFCSSIVPL